MFTCHWNKEIWHSQKSLKQIVMIWCCCPLGKQLQLEKGYSQLGSQLSQQWWGPDWHSILKSQKLLIKLLIHYDTMTMLIKTLLIMALLITLILVLALKFCNLEFTPLTPKTSSAAWPFFHFNASFWPPFNHPF